jgi:hypothetical protein
MMFLNVFSSKICYYDNYGDFSNGVHLFPFRTEKLSPLAQMVLHEMCGIVCRCRTYKEAVSKGQLLFFILRTCLNFIQ